MLNSLATRVDTATQASLPVHEMKALMEKLSRRAFLEGKDGSDGDQDWVTWWQSSVLSLSTMVNCPYKDIMRFVRQSVGLKQKMLDVHRDFIVQQRRLDNGLSRSIKTLHYDDNASYYEEEPVYRGDGGGGEERHVRGAGGHSRADVDANSRGGRWCAGGDRDVSRGGHPRDRSDG